MKLLQKISNALFYKGDSKVGFLEEKEGHRSFMRLLLLLFAIATIITMLYMVYKDNINVYLILGMASLILTGKVAQKYWGERDSKKNTETQTPLEINNEEPK